MKTPEEITQWVINNRYPRNEKEKVSDAEMYHSLVESIINLCNMPVVMQRSELLAFVKEVSEWDNYYSSTSLKLKAKQLLKANSA